MTAGLYISAGTIAEFLARERGLYHRLPEETGSAFPENMTLDEMIHSIVKRSLAENRGNQAITARKLGISRSTLWRMMKEKL